MLSRVIACVAGLVLLIGAAFVTLGMALSAPLGILVAHLYQRRRGQRLGAFSSWISAISGVLVALAVAAGVLESRLPPGTWDRVRHAADSASAQAAKEPPPAWLDRLAPGAASRYPMSAPPGSRAFNTMTIIWGTVLGVGFLGSFIGTLGWGGTMLLVYSASGRWLHDH